LKSKSIIFHAHTAALEFKIEFSPDDGTNWVERLADLDVAIGDYLLKTDTINTELAGLWQLCRISVRPNAAGVHGTGYYVFNGGTL
jgi:hypothetical protein